MRESSIRTCLIADVGLPGRDRAVGLSATRQQRRLVIAGGHLAERAIRNPVDAVDYVLLVGSRRFVYPPDLFLHVRPYLERDHGYDDVVKDCHLRELHVLEMARSSASLPQRKELPHRDNAPLCAGHGRELRPVSEMDVRREHREQVPSDRAKHPSDEVPAGMVGPSE